MDALAARVEANKSRTKPEAMAARLRTALAAVTAFAEDDTVVATHVAGSTWDLTRAIAEAKTLLAAAVPLLEDPQPHIDVTRLTECLHGGLMAVFQTRDDLVQTTPDGPYVNVRGIAEEAARIAASVIDG